LNNPYRSLTRIVTLALALPPGPVIVMVYCVVRLGDTMIDPLAGTSPIPGLMKALSALVDCHDKVADSPLRMLPGSTEKDIVGRGGMTVIWILSVTVPPGPVAVMA
jgi:hypothetical protein